MSEDKSDDAAPADEDQGGTTTGGDATVANDLEVEGEVLANGGETDEDGEEAEEVDEDLEALFANQPNMSASELDNEVQEQLESLRDEFGELSEILVDAAFNENVAEFLLDASDVISKHLDERAGKARFYMHREPNDDLYLLLSPKPAQFNSAWLQMQSRQPQAAVQAFERYADDILKTIMIKPRFQDVDWNLDGNGVNAPMGMTKSRIVDTFLSYEMNDPNEPTSTVFSEDEVDSAMEAAKKEQPSF